MPNDDSWRERRRALLRGDPAATEAAGRLLEEMGTEERDDEEVEADHRAARLAVAREYDPNAVLDQELPPRLPGPASAAFTSAWPPYESIPRPQQTPEALRAALALVAPDRLAEMQQTKDKAFARAVEWQSLSPVRSWVLIWARDIEIARRPDLSTRHAQAANNLEHADSTVSRQALRELNTVLDKAMQAVRADPAFTPP